MKHKTWCLISVIVLSVSHANADPGPLDTAWLKGTTDKSPIFYTPGEPMVFTIEPQDLAGEVPEGAFFLKWERSGDDGVVEKGQIPFDGKPFVYTTSLAKPGFVRVQAEVVTPDGKPYQKKFTGDATTPEGKIAMNKFEKAKKTVFFDGGAGVDIDSLQQGSPEPADFDAFWAREKEALAALPFNAKRVEIPCKNPDVRLYAVSVDCTGPRPMTGYLSIPKAAENDRKYGARLDTMGYGTREQKPPENPNAACINLTINAHGFLLREFGATDEYYKTFPSTIQSGKFSYGLNPDENAKAETSYFYGMTLRVIRALQYLKSLPEWDGKTLTAAGGSQGGTQSIWAAGCGEGVTRASSAITGFCDMGKDLVGRLRGGWPRVIHAPGLDYFDPVNFAKRVPATCVVDIPRAGLGDYTCEPSGIAVLWNNLKCPKSILWMQGSEHGYVPPKYEGRDFRREAKPGADELPAVRHDADEPSALRQGLFDSLTLGLLDSPWQVLPCWGGGYVQGATFCPSDPNRMYLYVDVGGPYRSDDAGASWVPLHGNMSVDMRDRGFDQVRSLSVDPRDADSLVVIGGANGDTPGGFAVTRDGGKTWSVKCDAFAYGNSPRRPDGLCLSRNPFNPDELVGGEDRSGIFVSRDNGETWTRTGPTGVWFTDIRHDATVKGRVYASAPGISLERMASMWVLGESRKTPRGSGFFRSDDGARTWRRLSGESPTEIAQIPGDRRIVGLFDRHRVMVSDDGGQSWKPFEDGLFISDAPRREPWADGAYYALAAGWDFWLLGDGNGTKYRRGRDDAAWTRLQDGRMVAGDPPNEQRLAGRDPKDIRMTALMTLVADPKDDAHWLATDWFELWETRDAGATWTTRVKGIMQLCSYDIAFDPNSKDNILCCMYDLGALVSHDGGKTFERARAARAGDRKFPNNVATAVYLKGHPGVVLCAGARGFDTGLWRSADAGSTWEPLPGTGLPPCVPGQSAASSLVQDPRDGSLLLTMSGFAAEGQGGVYRSRDEGVSWTWEGAGLAQAKGFDYDINHSQGAWPRLAVSPDGSMVTAGKRGESVVFARGPEDAEWRKTGLEQPDWRQYPLVADPFVPGRFLCGGGDGPVRESTDGGRTWHVMPALEKLANRGIAFDRHVQGSVVFGCRDGLYLSEDGGATIQPLAGGLQIPSGKSRFLALDRGRFFFLTSGSGIWKMGPLH